jgi:hypothetical protein
VTTSSNNTEVTVSKKHKKLSSTNAHIIPYQTCVEGSAPEAGPGAVHAADSVEIAAQRHQPALPPLGRQVSYRLPCVLLRVVHLHAALHQESL